MKLMKITFAKIPALPGVRAGDLSTIDCENPPSALAGWRAVLRGASLFLVSPPGWLPGENRASKRDPLGRHIVFEVPRSDAFLQWGADCADDLEAMYKGTKYESMPFGWKPAPIEADKPILAQIPPGQVGDA